MSINSELIKHKESINQMLEKKGIKDSVLYIASKQWNPGGSVDSTMFLEDRLHMNLNGYHLLDSCIASEIIRDYISRQSSTSKVPFIGRDLFSPVFHFSSSPCRR